MNTVEQTSRFESHFISYGESGPNHPTYSTWDPKVVQGEPWAHPHDIFSSPVPTYPSPPHARLDAWGGEITNDPQLWGVSHGQPIFYNEEHLNDHFLPSIEPNLEPSIEMMVSNWGYHPSCYGLPSSLDSQLPFTEPHQLDFHPRIDLVLPSQLNESQLHTNLSSLEQNIPSHFQPILDRPAKKPRKAKSIDANSSTPPSHDSNVKPPSGFKCDFVGCGKSFTRPYNLKAHARIHTQERPFACHICHYAFSRLHDMKRHMNLHSGIKPFQCPHCSKTFARLDALNRHIKKDAGTCASVSRSKFKRTHTL